MDSSSIINPASIINLNLSFKNLSTLDEYKKYKNLIELDLTGNSFKSAADVARVLCSFPFLKKLNIAYNNIQDCWELPHQIETLILNNNAITSMNDNLLAMGNLLTLDLSNNFLQDITPLTSLTKLKFLFLKNNKLTQVEALADLNFLLELDLEGNPIDDREQITRFADHNTIKVLNLKSTIFFNGESYLTGHQYSSPLQNLPFVKEGALCRNAKSLKSSYIYSNLADTSNPNRSVLINKSIINSRKYSSDSEFTDDDDETPREMPGSILGSVRSNYPESGRVLPNSDNSIRHDRKVSSTGEHHRQISSFDSKFSSTDKEPEKISTAVNSTRNQVEKEYNLKSAPHSVNNSMIFSGKPSMKLDLSSILKAKHTQPVHVSLHLQSANTNTNNNNNSFNNTANTSLFNSLNNSQIKISPILERPIHKDIPIDSKKAHPRLSLTSGTIPGLDTQSSGSNVTATFKLSNNHNAQNSHTQFEGYNQTQSNQNAMESYINNLLEENQGLKKEVDIIRQTNRDLEKKLNERQNETSKTQIDKAQTEFLKGENQILIDRLDVLENKYAAGKQEIRVEKIKHQQIQKALQELAKAHLDQVHDDNATVEQLITSLDNKLKKFKEGSKIDTNRRILDQFDQLREYYKFKEERLNMRINDLESEIAFKHNDKLISMQKLLKRYQKNLDLVIKKYNVLKHATNEKKIRESHPQIQISLPPQLVTQKATSDQAKTYSRKLHTLLSESSDNINSHNNTSLNLTYLVDETQISEIKDDHIHNLKNENIKLKQSLEGIKKKFDNVIKENDDLKTVSNRNTYSLKTKIRDLEADNKRLQTILGKKEFAQSPNASAHHNSGIVSSETRARNNNAYSNNKSVEIKSRSSQLNSSLVLPEKHHSSSIKTSVTLSSHKRDSVKDSSINKDNSMTRDYNTAKEYSASKVQNYIQSLKKSSADSDVNGHNRKGVYTKKLSKILEANDKKGRKIQNYI